MLLRCPAKFAAVSALLALAAAPAALGAQVSVDELEMHFQLAPGRRELTQVIPVRNDEARPQQVRVILNDWQRDTLGRNEFLAVGTHPGSCRDKVKVSPVAFQLAPGAVEYVRVSYDAAGDLAGCWTIVLLESAQPAPTQAAQRGAPPSIGVRIGVKVYVHAPNEVRAGEIVRAAVVQAWVPKELPPGAPRGPRRDSTQVMQLAVRFHNSGSAHLRFKATVDILDGQGKSVQQLVSPEAYVTPEALRDLPLTLPKLASGAYRAVVRADFGGAQVAATEVAFSVP
jgi:P pilus assembly chaperone PapD